MTSAFSSRCGDVLAARSGDGSLLAVHRREGDDPSAHSRTTVRCYDGRVAGGSLKFTLSTLRRDGRVTDVVSSSGADDDAAPTSPSDDVSPVRKLVFVSPRDGDGDGSSSSGTANAAKPPRHLCAVRSDSVQVWDLERAVLTHAFSPARDLAGNDGDSKKKKKRRSSAGGNSGGILCDVAARNGFLYALVLCVDGESEGGPKCRVLEYDLASSKVNGLCLKRKMKLSSLSEDVISETGSGSSGSSPAAVMRSLVGLAIKGTEVALRLGDVVRVFDLGNASKLRKISLPKKLLPGRSSVGSEGDAAALSFSDDGRWIGTSTPSGAVICSNVGKEGLVVANLGASDGGLISHLDLRVLGSKTGNIAITAHQSSTGASVYTLSLDSVTGKKLDASAPPTKAVATIRAKDVKSSHRIAMATFHPVRSDQDLSILLVGTSSRGAIQLQEMRYADDSSQGGSNILLKGKVAVEMTSEIADGGGKKRKNADIDVVLGPGELGGEASLASDVQFNDRKKKQKSAAGDDDEDDFHLNGEDADGVAGQGQSIAERLALLSSAIEQSSDEEEEDADSGDKAVSKGSAGFSAKSATPESLASLLSQALSSADNGKLESAFDVRDKRIIEHSVAALQVMDRQEGQRTELVSNLLVQLVTRISRRPARAATLGGWVKAVLVVLVRSGEDGEAGLGRMGKEGLDVALKLGPLRNLLNERVECFPHLLRLEGRLGLLGQHL